MALINNALKTRISKLEERRAIAPDDNAPRTPMEQYLAMLNERPKRPRNWHERPLEKRLGRPLTPEEAYRIMTGELDPKTLH